MALRALCPSSRVRPTFESRRIAGERKERVGRPEGRAVHGKVCSGNLEDTLRGQRTPCWREGEKETPGKEECFGEWHFAGWGWALVFAVCFVSLLLWGLSVVGSQKRALEPCRGKGGAGPTEQDGPQQSQSQTQRTRGCPPVPAALPSGMVLLLCSRVHGPVPLTPSCPPLTPLLQDSLAWPFPSIHIKATVSGCTGHSCSQACMPWTPPGFHLHVLLGNKIAEGLRVYFSPGSKCCCLKNVPGVCWIVNES